MSIPVALLLVVANAPGEKHWAEFVGFSEDGRFAAYREDVDILREAGQHDQYSLYHTVDARSGFAVAAFHASAIHRIGPDGRPVKKKKAELERINPTFANAYSNKKWRALEKRSAFAMRRVELDGGIIQVTADPGIELASQMTGDGLMLGTEIGAAMGFRVAVLDRAGEVHSLGRFQQRAQEGWATVAQLQLFASVDGTKSALLVKFLRQAAGSVSTSFKVAVKPIALAKLGIARAPKRPQPAGVDPWNTKGGLEPPMPKVDRDKAQRGMSAKERKNMRQVKQVYEWFAHGKKLPPVEGEEAAPE